MKVSGRILTIQGRQSYQKKSLTHQSQMPVLQRQLKIFKAQNISRKRIIKNGDRILVLGQGEFLQGPAFASHWKNAAIEVCESYIERGIPSIIVESHDYFMVWHSRPHVLAQLAPAAESAPPDAFPFLKRLLSIGFPCLILAAIAGISFNRIQSTCQPKDIVESPSSSHSTISKQCI